MKRYFRSDLLNIDRTVSIDVPHAPVMMCLNEAPYDPGEVLGESFATAISTMELNHYFSDVTPQLHNALAEYVGHGLSPDSILMGNGADEMLYFLFTSVREESTSFAVALSPSYFDYKSYTRAVGMGLVGVSLDNSFEFDPDQFLAQTRREGCRLAILCNPNNPTGNCFDPEKLLYVVSRATVPVVVDETYFEFSGETLAGAIARHENLLIIRSFSKAFGAAGLRFGYLLAQPRTALQVKKTMTAFNLSLLIQRAVLEVVRGAHRFAPYIEELVSQREAMVDALLSMGVSAHRTKTNFIPFTLGERSGALHDFLTEAGVAVRSVSGHPILANYLRVSVHSCQNNERFLSLVKSFTQR